MGGERLYTGQPGPGSSAAIAPESRALGQIFQCSQANRYIVGGAFWVNAGVYPELWQLWLKGAGTQQASHALASLNPSGTGWHYFTLAELNKPIIGPLATATDYIVNTWTPSGPGNYVFSSGTAYPFGTSPLSTSANIFGNSRASTLIPNDETFTNGRFYADVTLDSFATPPPARILPSRAVRQASRW